MTLFNVFLSMKLPNMRAQTTSCFEISQAKITLVFNPHNMSFNVHSHVTFLFILFITSGTGTRPQGLTTLVHNFIHHSVKFGIKLLWNKKETLHNAMVQRNCIFVAVWGQMASYHHHKY